MARRTVSLDASTYQLLRAAKRPGETFSQTINRILTQSTPNFRVLIGAMSPNEAERIRSGIAEMRAAEAAAERARFPGPGGKMAERQRKDQDFQ